jgi:hypothetical protein
MREKIKQINGMKTQAILQDIFICAQQTVWYSVNLNENDSNQNILYRGQVYLSTGKQHDVFSVLHLPSC